MSQWIHICHIDQIQPGAGVCALVSDQQVALFRPYADEQVYGMTNIDPFAGSSVLSRGIVCEHQDELWVASPLKKQRFALKDGRCLEDSQKNIRTFAVQVVNGEVSVQV